MSEDEVRNKADQARRLQAGPRRLLGRLRELMAVRENPQDRLDHLVNLIAEESGWEVCSIYLSRRSSALELCATHGLNQEAVHTTRLRPGEGLVGLVARRARPLAVADAPAHPAFSYKPETGEEPFKSFVGVPILRGGRLVGVLTAQTAAQREIGEDEIETLQTVAMVLAEIVASGEMGEAEEMAGVEVRPSRPERFQGGAFSNGLSFGTAVKFEPHVENAQKLIASDSDEEEIRLEKAINALRRSIDDMLDTGRVPFGGPTRDVLEAYRMFAHDRGWLERLRDAVRRGLTAEAAVERVRNENRARLMKANDQFFRERLHDLEDLANRLLRHLGGGRAVDLPDNAILVARNIGPAELLDFDRDKLKGVALEEGSASSHAAIVAKALGIPLVGELEGALDSVEDGDPLILDGEFGVLMIRPAQDVVDTYSERMQARARRQRSYAKLRHAPCVTRDGQKIALTMNAGLLIEMTQLDETGADGVGLFRTEFQFMVSDTLPRLDAQAALYRSVLEAAGDNPVVFRTLDLGGDKVAPFAPTNREPNPALGWRAVRMGLDRPGLLRYQMRALIKAAEGRHLQLMFPMIAAPWEMRQARAYLSKELDQAAKRGEPGPSSVSVGMMMETPGIAFALERCMEDVDFIAVGANDLMQYFFAADRDNPRVSSRYDVLSPPALGLLKQVRDVCAAHDKPVSICGEMAARPLEAAVLAGLGYRSLSMAAGSIGPVKKTLAGTDAGRLGAWLAEHLDTPADSLRDVLLQDWEKAGLPKEAVENRRAI